MITIFHCLISIIFFYGISNTYNKKFECYKIKLKEETRCKALESYSYMFLTYFFLIWCKPLIDNYKLSVAMLSSEKAYILNVYNQSLWDKCILRFLFEMFINRFFFPSIFFQSGREICMLAWLQITGLYNFGHFLAEKIWHQSGLLQLGEYTVRFQKIRNKTL